MTIFGWLWWSPRKAPTRIRGAGCRLLPRLQAATATMVSEKRLTSPLPPLPQTSRSSTNSMPTSRQATPIFELVVKNQTACYKQSQINYRLPGDLTDG